MAEVYHLLMIESGSQTNWKGGQNAPLTKLVFSDEFNAEQIDEARDNIRLSLAYYGDLKRIEMQEAHGRKAAIVGGGPSLKNNLDKLRDFAGEIFCANEAHDYLIDNGIEPDGFVFLEVHPWVNDQLCRRTSERCTYYIPSHCHLSAFDRVSGRDVVMWHARSGIGEEDIIAEFEADPMLVNGASTPGLRAVHIAMVLGYRDFELFGVDASHADGDRHSYDTPGRVHKPVLEITCLGRTFHTDGYLAQQADEFQRLCRNFPEIKIKAHGDGLIQHIHRAISPFTYSAEKDTLS